MSNGESDAEKSPKEPVAMTSFATVTNAAATLHGRWQRAALGFLALMLMVFALRHAGDDYLAVEDPLVPAQTAVVLGGDPEFRGGEAATLYKQSFVRQIWLTAMLEDIYSRDVFEHMGVPRSAVRIFDWHEANTAAELRAIACELQRSGGGDSVIFVTSTYHSRRVKLLWQKLTGDHPHAIVRYAT